MAVSVIDLFKIIQVNKNHGHLPIPVFFLQFTLGIFLDAFSVHDTGKIVPAHLSFQSLQLLFLFLDINEKTYAGPGFSIFAILEIQTEQIPLGTSFLVCQLDFFFKDFLLFHGFFHSIQKFPFFLRSHASGLLKPLQIICDLGIFAKLIYPFCRERNLSFFNIPFINDMIHFIHEQTDFFQAQAQFLSFFYQLLIYLPDFPLLRQFLYLIPVSGRRSDHCHPPGYGHIDQAAELNVRKGCQGKSQGCAAVNTESVNGQRLNNNGRTHDAGHNHRKVPSVLGFCNIVIVQHAVPDHSHSAVSTLKEYLPLFPLLLSEYFLGRQKAQIDQKKCTVKSKINPVIQCLKSAFRPHQNMKDIDCLHKGSQNTDHSHQTPVIVKKLFPETVSYLLWYTYQYF